MQVMVTGGTGFVGAHTVKALLDAGHGVRLLVRDPGRIDQNLKPLGVDHVDHVVGDMGDEASVRHALEGCQAVVHAAAVVALERRRSAEVLDANPRGADVVLRSAAEAGLDPIIHVSSVSALFAPGVERLHAGLPPTTSASAYARSKAMAEEVARRLQAEGAPVVITYPGGVIGPAAGSATGEVADSLVLQLRLGVLPLRAGSWSIIDVRDVAAVHAAALERGKGARRYVCGGHLLTMEETAAVYRRITKRRFAVAPVPGAALRGVGRVMDAVMRVAPVESVLTSEGMAMLTRWVPTDDRLVTEELGVRLRPPEESFADAIRSLLVAGRITARQAGALAGDRR